MDVLDAQWVYGYAILHNVVSQLLAENKWLVCCGGDVEAAVVLQCRQGNAWSH